MPTKQRHSRWFSSGLPVVVLAIAACSGGGGSGSPGTGVDDPGTPDSGDDTAQQILFVGNSFTHGRYAPVRQFNNGGHEGQAGGSALVVDENEGQTGARAEDDETGPFGGIPGLFAEFAVEAGLDYVVHIEAISSATLQGHYSKASDVIVDSKWDAVVLQEQSTRPIPFALSGNDNSNPSAFCSSVKTIEQAVHAVAPTAGIYLYQTWARADEAKALAGNPSSAGFPAAYADALKQLGQSYHDVFYRAAALDGRIAAVAPAGEAWSRAWANGVANPDPFSGSAPGPSLWYGINSSNDPAISAPDYYHPSIYGAYLSALVLFQQITGVDVRTLGAAETAATALGISSTIAVQLQQAAWQTITMANPALFDTDADPCSVTH